MCSNVLEQKSYVFYRQKLSKFKTLLYVPSIFNCVLHRSSSIDFFQLDKSNSNWNNVKSIKVPKHKNVSHVAAGLILLIFVWGLL